MGAGDRTLEIADRTYFSPDLAATSEAFEYPVMTELYAGTLRHGRRMKLSAEVAIDALVPDGGRLELELTGERFRYELQRGDGWILALHAAWESPTLVLLAASTASLADELADAIKARDPHPEQGENTVAVHFWYGEETFRSRLSTVRRINAARWPSIRRNYPADVASASTA